MTRLRIATEQRDTPDDFATFAPWHLEAAVKALRAALADYRACPNDVSRERLREARRRVQAWLRVVERLP